MKNLNSIQILVLILIALAIKLVYTEYRMDSQFPDDTDPISTDDVLTYQNAQTSLLKTLMKDYSNSVAPNAQNKSMIWNFGMNLLSVNSIETTKQQMSSDFNIYSKWKGIFTFEI